MWEKFLAKKLTELASGAWEKEVMDCFDLLL